MSINVSIKGWCPSKQLTCFPSQMVSYGRMPSNTALGIETMEGDLEAESDSECPLSRSFLGCTACSVSGVLSLLAH